MMCSDISVKTQRERCGGDVRVDKIVPVPIILDTVVRWVLLRVSPCCRGCWPDMHMLRRVGFRTFDLMPTPLQSTWLSTRSLRWCLLMGIGIFFKKPSYSAWSNCKSFCSLRPKRKTDALNRWQVHFIFKIIRLVGVINNHRKKYGKWRRCSLHKSSFLYIKFGATGELVGLIVICRQSIENHTHAYVANPIVSEINFESVFSTRSKNMIIRVNDTFTLATATWRKLGEAA